MEDPQSSADEVVGGLPATTSTPQHPAGWFPDPYGRTAQRYWDGVTWTNYAVDHTGEQCIDDPSVRLSPTPGYAPDAGREGIVVQNVVTTSGPAVGPWMLKSRGAAFALTFFFGPLGMFYSTVTGALIMVAISLVLVPLTLGLAVIVLWPASIIWGVLAAGHHNNNMLAMSGVGQAAGGQAVANSAGVA